MFNEFDQRFTFQISNYSTSLNNLRLQSYSNRNQDLYHQMIQIPALFNSSPHLYTSPSFSPFFMIGFRKELPCEFYN